MRVILLAAAVALLAGAAAAEPPASPAPEVQPARRPSADAYTPPRPHSTPQRPRHVSQLKPCRKHESRCGTGPHGQQRWP